ARRSPRRNRAAPSDRSPASAAPRAPSRARGRGGRSPCLDDLDGAIGTVLHLPDTSHDLARLVERARGAGIGALWPPVRRLSQVAVAGPEGLAVVALVLLCPFVDDTLRDVARNADGCFHTPKAPGPCGLWGWGWGRGRERDRVTKSRLGRVGREPRRRFRRDGGASRSRGRGLSVRGRCRPAGPAGARWCPP